MTKARRQPSPPRPLQMGEPTPYREVKSTGGFERQQLAAGMDREGGVLQARERAPLTPLDMRKDLVLAQLEKLLRKDPNANYMDASAQIGGKLTAIDKMLSPHEIKPLAMMMQIHAKAESGHASISNYTGAQRAGHNEDDGEERDHYRERLAGYHYVFDRLTPSQQEFFDQFCYQNFPTMREGRPLLGRELGKAFIHSEDARLHEGAYRARVKELALAIIAYLSDWDIERRRRVTAAKQRQQAIKRASVTNTEVIMPDDYFSQL